MAWDTTGARVGVVEGFTKGFGGLCRSVDVVGGCGGLWKAFGGVAGGLLEGPWSIVKTTHGPGGFSAETVKCGCRSSWEGGARHATRLLGEWGV